MAGNPARPGCYRSGFYEPGVDGETSFLERLLWDFFLFKFSRKCRIIPAKSLIVLFQWHVLFLYSAGNIIERIIEALSLNEKDNYIFYEFKK